MQQVHGHSVIYCIALGPQQGKKVFTQQKIPGRYGTVRARNNDGASTASWSDFPRKIHARLRAGFPMIVRNFVFFTL